MLESILASLEIGVASLIVLAVAFVLLAIALLSRVARQATLRRIGAYEVVAQAPTRAAESDLPIHLGLGSGSVGGEDAPQTAAAIQAARYLTSGGAAGASRTVLTAGDATAMAAAMGAIDANAYANAETRFAGPNPMAFAAGAKAMAPDEPMATHVLLGKFGDEGLWLAGALSRGSRTPVGGTVEPSASALMYAAMDDAVIGEEVYAAGAYLGDQNQVASLVAADLLRWLGVAAMVLGTLALSLGWWR